MERVTGIQRVTPHLPVENDSALEAGARNLLVGCAELQPGQNLLILHEDPALGWFDLDAPLAVADMAKSMGAEVTTLQVGGPDTALPAEFLSGRWRADVEIWFARIGDQDRFQSQDSDRIKIVSYARTANALASTYGTKPHSEMLDLKDRVNTRIATATSIHVTCPSGTDIHGSSDCDEVQDVTVRRFPMCVPCPTPADTFSGTVALSGYLTPTGSKSYQPSSLALVDTVMAYIEHGRIIGFDGNPATVQDIYAHYQHVASLFDIDPFIVHSFHAGIHEGCTYTWLENGDPDLCSNTVFGSPKWLHFHTCGNYAPGEICWMIKDPNIRVDNHALWSKGRLLL